MNKNAVLIAILSPFFLLLSGCAMFQDNTPAPIKYVPVGNDASMNRLNAVAEKAERTTQVIAKIQAAKANSTVTLEGSRRAELAQTATPKGWGKTTSLDFQGPFNKVVYQLALKAGYEYYENGHAPANVPLVTLSAKNKTLKAILNQVVAQLPKSVTIAIYPSTKSFVVTYS